MSQGKKVEKRENHLIRRLSIQEKSETYIRTKTTFNHIKLYLQFVAFLFELICKLKVKEVIV